MINKARLFTRENYRRANHECARHRLNEPLFAWRSEVYFSHGPGPCPACALPLKVGLPCIANSTTIC
jgi:hypothetical protein